MKKGWVKSFGPKVRGYTFAVLGIAAVTAVLAPFHERLSSTTVALALLALLAHLTPKEYELLIYLIHHPNKALTHRALPGAVWGGDYVEQTEYLRVFIGQLRGKIEAGPAKPRYILTEPWIGYRFNPEI